MVTIPQIPDLLEEAGLKRVGAARIRQLVATDPAWPKPVFSHRQTRLFDWREVEAYFRQRVTRQGERTDLKRSRERSGAGGRSADRP